MKKKRLLAFVLAGIVSLSSGGCGTTGDDSEEPVFEAYHQAVSDNDIVLGDEACFVDSQIVLTAADGASQRQIEKLVKKQGGSVVGYLSISNDYQIEFADGKTYEELDAIITELEKQDEVEAVSLNYASQINAGSIDYTSDPWIDANNADDSSGSEWSETSPDGNNWWAEAIMMPSVWNLDLKLQPVKVGIYDTMFDTDNKDLDDVFVKVWNNPEDKNGNCTVSALYSKAKQAGQDTTIYDHGTHVAGLIAAKAANHAGIAGVSQNAQLYGFSFCSEPTETGEVSRWNDLFEIKYSIALMIQEGVKVINFSVGEDEMLVAAQHGVEKARTELREWSTSYELFLKKCFQAGYDFLIVRAAGNENQAPWTACEVSEEHPYGYKMDNTATDDTVYDAQYDVLGAIEDETVKSHILIVGAAANGVTHYTTAYFSTVGERVDVYAPGVDILSDLPINSSGNIAGMTSGTSNAAPIVSGIAALVWGVNPNLSAVQVADIIRASISVSLFDSERVSSESDPVETTPIVNAYFAVQLAQAASAQSDGTTGNVGILTGMAYTTATDGSVNELSGVSVTVADSAGNTVETAVTSELSGYTFVLPAGTYTMTAEADGYASVNRKVSLTENGVLNVNLEMNPDNLGVDIMDYLTNYRDLVSILNMEPANSWQFFSSGQSYAIDGFYLEWLDSIFSMKIEAQSPVTFYGYSFGDASDSFVRQLEENGWFYMYDGTYGKVTQTDNLFLEFETNEQGAITFLYLNNWPEGEGIADYYNTALQ